MAVNTSIDRSVPHSSVIDRWIYVFTAVMFLVVAVIGFYPTSTGLLADVEAGIRPPPPLILHIHAALMVGWLFLFFSQTTLMALDRRELHKTLGLASLALIPAIVLVTSAVLTGGWRLLASPPPNMNAADLELFQRFISNIFLLQVFAIALFVLFVVWALRVRKRDSETHKRMMLMATLMPLTAAVGRMFDMRMNMSESPVTVLLVTLLLLAPVLLVDVIRRGRPHQAYVNGVALYIVAAIPVYLLWENPWWLETIPVFMGLG
jgi:hypothetical protein